MGGCEGRRGQRWAYRLAGIFVLAMACQSKPSSFAQVEVQVLGKLSGTAAAPLEAQATRIWNLGLKANATRVQGRKAGVRLRVWEEPPSEPHPEPILYLGVVWPEGFVKGPLHTPLRSPMKLGVAVDPKAPAEQEYPAALQTLVDLYWTQLRLAQTPWPIPASWLREPHSLAQRSMTADWLGQHGRVNPELARGCVALLAHATQDPWRPQIERLESSVACLAKVADSTALPAILDHMPNGHLRVEMLRVELLGGLGGALARSELRWVQEQAQEPALVSAATSALEKLQ